MTATELKRMIEAERGSGPGAVQVERGWSRVRDSFEAGVAPPADLPLHGPLELGATSLATTAGLKMVAGGVAVIAIASGVAVATNPGAGHDSGPHRVAAVTAPEPSAAAPGDRAVPAPQPSVPRPREPSVEEAASPQPAPRSARSNRVGGGSSDGSASTFEVELGLIKRAKSALDGDHANEALQLLAEHSRRFPSGVFAGEREALRALALCQSGQHAQGKALAQRFLATYSRSPLVDRVRQECGVPGSR